MMQAETFNGKIAAALQWAREQDKEWHSTGVHAAAIGNLWTFLEPLGIESAVEIGSGAVPSPMSEMMVAHGVAYTGVDVLNGPVKADMHDLPFDDDAFDIAVSRHSLEHALVPYVALMEMMRVSRRWLLVVLPEDTPHCPDSPGHLYVMGKLGWENVFRRLGLTIVRYEIADISDGIYQGEWIWLLSK